MVRAASSTGSDAGVLAPLRQPGIFRLIWSASLAANFGVLIQDVGAAWLMTSLSPEPAMVALVQTANLAPILLFALFAGALADTFDRRRVLLAAQLWAGTVSLGLACMSLLGLVGPWLLLLFTFAVGSGVALNGPAWQATVREIVPQGNLAAAVTLTAIAYNIARAIGPAVGGALVASFGAQVAFFVNAVCSLCMIGVLVSWRRPAAVNDLPRERLGHAVVAGLRYVQETPAIRVVLGRGSVFSGVAAALMALLPLVARDRLGGNAALYGALLGAFGVGALAGAFAIHPLRGRYGAEAVITGLSAACGAALLVLGLTQSLLPVMLALAVAGAAWLGSFSTFNISVQLVTAPWVQARVLALYQTTVFGTMALGSWLWGHVAGALGLDRALLAAGTILLASLALHRVLPVRGGTPDLRPMESAREDPKPVVPFGFEEGPVLVTVEYRVPAGNADLFRRAMEELGHLRRRDGARRWDLYQDVTAGERWVEAFTLGSWFDYLRQRRRATAADEAVFQRARALIDAGFSPQVRRMIHRHERRDGH